MTECARTATRRAPGKAARRRAEMIVQVRAGLLTATCAARSLGISRKTYYEWEGRALAAMLKALEDRPSGRPATAPDGRTARLEREVDSLRRELSVKERIIEIRDRLRSMEERDGMSDSAIRPSPQKKKEARKPRARSSNS